MKSFKHIFFLTNFLWAAICSSQQLRFKQITSEDGLSTNFVKCIIQDDKGFMWFGTQDGLNKYDGFQIKVFKNDPTNANSLISSDITALKQISQDLIVVGTNDGINFFNPITGKFSILSKAPSGIKRKINTITLIDKDNILVGSDEGLFMVNLKDKTVKKSFFSESEKVIIKSVQDINGTIFVGTMERGLWRLKNKQEIEKVELIVPDFLSIKKISLESITHIEHYAGKIYIGTYEFGIFKVGENFEIESVISFATQNENSNFVRDFVAKNNKLYVASAYGVLVYNLITEEVNFYTKQDAAFSINSNPSNCICLDNQNNFWIGTDLGGVNISFFRSLKFPNSNHKYETAFENIFSFGEDENGATKVGGVKTFHEINLETGKTTDHSKFLENGTALCMVQENENVFWIGSWGNGIYRYDKSTKKTTTILSNQLGGTIVCLFIREGFIYAGSVGDGLFKINLRTFEVTQFNEEDGLPRPGINSIFVDNKGNVWIGTYDGGLVKMKGFDSNGKLPIEKIYTNTGKPREIASNVILSVNQDKNGYIWIATSSGLSKLMSDGSFYNFYEKDGLASSYLYSLLKDSLGNFWMSSNNGIIKFNPLQNEKEITFKNYGTKDGLVNTEYNMGAAYVAKSGRMYFGGAKGFNCFRPSQIKDNLHPPSAYVIGYKRGGNDVETDSSIIYKKHLNLNWTENYFQFELVALDYTDPSKNKFKYKLEGYDKDWSAPTNVRYVSYTELPGGEYSFKVKAANNDGIWNEEIYEVKITVVPPFWKTKTFYILLFTFGFLGIYAFIQYRTRAIKKENKILENKVAERTKELEEKNRDITSSIEYAKRIQEAILPARDHIFRELKKIFILYKPKDIVSGDFYWFTEKNGIKIFAVVDCTGHGVPGAFMSMIGHNVLNQVVKERGITDPADILNNIHKGVQSALRQGHNEIKTNDGMDVSLLTINESKKEVRWAGANRPLILLAADGSFNKIDGNKFPVGGAQTEGDRVFTTQIIETKGPTMAYMFSDGYADQFGGEKGKKFMLKRLHELLGIIHSWDSELQKSELEKHFEDWRRTHEQVDDVLVVGIQI